MKSLRLVEAIVKSPRLHFEAKVSHRFESTVDFYPVVAVLDWHHSRPLPLLELLILGLANQDARALMEHLHALVLSVVDTGLKTAQFGFSHKLLWGHLLLRAKDAQEIDRLLIRKRLLRFLFV